MNKTLLIFIDSLGYLKIDDMKFLSSLKDNTAKFMPGFGYSINVKAEMFGGLRPDDIGYLNEWAYQPDCHLRKYPPLLRTLSPLQHSYPIDRIAHKIISKLYRQNILNIPFRYLSFFTKNGIEPYRDEFPLPTIFSKMSNLKKICYYHYSYGPKRDHQIFSDTMKAISDGTHENIFAAFGDLDGITHEYGVGSEEYNKKVEELDNYLCEMYKEFSSKYPKGTFLLTSDHGMANVTKSVDINMEKEFGRAMEETYLYFIDSTMLRVWTFEEGKKKEIESHLNSLGFGKIVDTEGRSRYGIASKKFGDIIFLLNEGAVFCPGFFGRKQVNAMHGYSPELESQAGLCLCLDGNNSNTELPPKLGPIELYKFLNNRFKSQS
jgi:predicted AlkP superfamily pyrophosphatase or phosphodiesterase